MFRLKILHLLPQPRLSFLLFTSLIILTLLTSCSGQTIEANSSLSSTPSLASNSATPAVSSSQTTTNSPAAYQGNPQTSAPSPTSTPPQVSDVFPTRSGPTPDLNVTPDPVQGLQNALALADTEMQAANQSTSLEEAKVHAEAVVNILVGYWGLWYGDANGDGKISDPSNGYGVLPAGRTQEAAPDTRAAQTQLGWAIKLYEQGSPQTQQQMQALLGNVEQWRTDPTSAYAEIQRAVQAADAKHNQVAKLSGQMPQAVGWARLILTKAQMLEEAQAFAQQGMQRTATARQLSEQVQ